CLRASTSSLPLSTSPNSLANPHPSCILRSPRCVGAAGPSRGGKEMMMANDRMRCVSLGLAAAILSAAGLPASAQCPTEWLLASAGFPNVPTDPPVRQNHAAAFDAARAQVVLFGGYLAGTGYRGDTWTWDG